MGYETKFTFGAIDKVTTVLNMNKRVVYFLVNDIGVKNLDGKHLVFDISDEPLKISVGFKSSEIQSVTILL